jgi:hypothetical protein
VRCYRNYAGRQELAEKIAKHKVRTDGCFCRQEIYLNGWSSLDTPEKAKQAAEVLADAGWIRELSGESSPLGGRPANRFAVNPRYPHAGILPTWTNNEPTKPSEPT